MNTVSITTDAPADPATVAKYGDAIPELVRALNHVTRHHEALHYPSDADRLIRALAATAERLPQLLEQVSRWLEAERAAGGILVGAGEYAGNPDLAAVATRIHLDAAAAHANALREALGAAASVTCDMGGVEGDGSAEGSEG